MGPIPSNKILKKIQSNIVLLQTCVLSYFKQTRLKKTQVGKTLSQLLYSCIKAKALYLSY